MGPKLVPGVFGETTGPVSCKVQGESGQIQRRHFDQLIRQAKPVSPQPVVMETQHESLTNIPKPVSTPVRQPSISAEPISPGQVDRTPCRVTGPGSVGSGGPPALTPGTIIQKSAAELGPRRSSRPPKPRKILDL